MGIFTKDCPVCATSHPVHKVRCDCGYCFDPNKLDGQAQDLDIIETEEELYRDYLSARATQADQEWQVAKKLAATLADSHVKKAESLLAEQAARAAHAELEAQESLLRSIKVRVKAVRASARSRKPPAVVAVPKKQIPSPPVSTPIPEPSEIIKADAPTAKVVAHPTKAKVAKHPAANKKHTPAPRAVPANANHHGSKPVSIAVIPKAPVASPSVTVSVPIKVMAPVPRIVPVEKPTPAMVTTPMPTIAPVEITPVLPTAPERAPIVVAAPTPSIVPTASADIAPLSKPVAPAPVVVAPTPLVSRKPTPVFSAVQTTKAAAVVNTGSQECPNCTAKVPANATRCGCGFEMPQSSSQMPGLSMSAEDREAFLALLSPVTPKGPKR